MEYSITVSAAESWNKIQKDMKKRYATSRSILQGKLKQVLVMFIYLKSH